MISFKLEEFLIISELGAASGLVYKNDILYIVSDHSSYLYEYEIDSKNLHKIPLTEQPAERIAKKDKKDLEAISIRKSKLYLLGSGSKENRNSLFICNLNTKKTKEKSVANLFKKIKKKCKIPSEELNIEGLFFDESYAYLWQRGNGSKGMNGIVKVDWKTKKIKEWLPIKLPEINGINATFTDAIKVNNKIFFLGAAEASNSTYLDGEIAGSIFGVLHAHSFSLEKNITISTTHKFEGITLYAFNEEKYTFLLCEDSDENENKFATIYTLTVSLNED